MDRRIAGVIAGLALMAAGVATFLSARSASTQFDAAAWQLGADPLYGGEAPRLRLADGLVRSRSLLGKSASEVEAMLGPTSRSGYFREFDFVYWLGPERSFVSIDSEWLVIKLAADGQVKEARIVTD